MSPLPTQPLSVVVPCRNESSHIHGLLDALAGQDVPPFEVIVADGSSDDGTPDIVRAYAAGHPALSIRLVDNPARSIPAALNLAIREARCSTIARLDGHSCPPPDYLQMCAEVKTETRAAVVGGVWDTVPGGPGPVADAIALAVSSPMGAGGARYRRSGAAVAGPVETVPFGCFDRETWQAVGGFDETLLANEDYAFNHAVRQAGGLVYLDPRIRCRYFARATFSGLGAQYWRYGWWKARMVRRFPESFLWRQFLPVAWCALALATIPAAFFEGVLPISIGVWVGYLLSLLCAAGLAAGRRGMWRLLPRVVAAYAIVHFCWGFGFWAGLVNPDATAGPT